MLYSKSGSDPVLQQRVEGAARWMDLTVRTCDVDAVEDWEVDEMLTWSTGLDFDEYWKDWQSIATSDLSEAAVCTLLCWFCFKLNVIVRRRRRFWHVTHDCVAPYVDIILQRGRF